MSLRSAAILAALLCSSAQGAELELEVPAGHYEDCEFVDLGSRREVQGMIVLSRLSAHAQWAPGITVVLTGEQRLFRLVVAGAATLQSLVARYEIFADGRRVVAEDLAAAAPDHLIPFRLDWSRNGSVSVSAGGSATRVLLVDMKPERAFVVISGAKGEIRTSGPEKLDCSKQIPAPGEAK